MKPTPKKPASTELRDQKKGNKGGRPTKEEALKKSNRLYLHLTEEEARSFDAAWQQHRLTRKISRNEFAKQRLFATSVFGNLLPKSKAGVDSKLLLDRLDQGIKLLNQFVIQLRTIGQNYNQSVKRLNNVYLSNEVRAEITQQRGLLLEIAKLIQWSDQQYKQADLLGETLNS
ncbi:plasmid mobilization protein [Spirosoma jeollabukense]